MLSHIHKTKLEQLIHIRFLNNIVKFAIHFCFSLKGKRESRPAAGDAIELQAIDNRGKRKQHK